MTVDVTTGTEIEVLPPARPAVSEAIGQLMMHADAMVHAKALADALCDSDLVPATYRGKPGNGAAAILYGAELGLNPIQSLQQIFVVHGAPAIYARTAVALVKRHGVVVETVSSTNEAVTVRGSDRRTGQTEQSTWDIPRAQLAGYTSNKKYQTDPQAMLYAKAAMEVCRKIAPDVLLGIPYSREELEMEQQPTRVRSERGGVGVKALRERAAAANEVPDPAVAPQADKPQAEPALSASARTKWVKSMFAALNDGDCKDKDDQLIVITLLAGRGFNDMPEHRDGISDDELRRVVETLGNWKKDGYLNDGIVNILNDYRSATEDEPTGDAQAADEMASKADLAKLAQIREAERYEDDAAWFAYVHAATGAAVTADKDLTLDQARQLIDIFNADNEN